MSAEGYWNANAASLQTQTNVLFLLLNKNNS